MKKEIYILFYLLILPLLLIPSAHSAPLNNLIDNGGFLFPKKGSHYKFVGQKADSLFIPASTTKVITTLVAMKTLGGAYRFKTQFYKKNNTLTIVGGGDPYLVSQEVEAICQKLKEEGVAKIDTLIIDNSLYALPHPASGTEDSLQPYDSHVSALAVNFNSMSVRVNSKGRVRSDEKQTPHLPLLQDLPTLKKGGHRVNVNGLGKNGLTGPERYAGQLFLALMTKVGINVENAKITVGKVPRGSQRILLWKSRDTLKTNLQKCLRYSNNFIANQVFLQLSHNTPPVSWQKSATIVTHHLQSLGLSQKQVKIVEGSGLSRENHITPRAMNRILLHFKPYHELLPHNKKTDTFFKTGTLKGVYTLAGYVHGKSGLSPFSIFLNQSKNTRKAVLKKLLQQYRTSQSTL